jgi:hypothetical protein
MKTKAVSIYSNQVLTLRRFDRTNMASISVLLLGICRFAESATGRLLNSKLIGITADIILRSALN